ncbi:anti-sigma factor domain-containing protein [Pseudoduganella plicata]|uniref:DNA-directed RNA polymerase sigma-70 factor n=1 Tax=Pseudoduganella plicata TaxID=321984 RepID=A0A4P7BKG8_9BURK|nr:anti-sigma factor [Pseudoduganella plicata]QBQ38059.1 RNA polymerase subunit sigma-70 [Pseudoduganella plicata]GGZ03345.1 DNA-directed RNA polymerase sigma-70 factor [Pseudoduganella plicata]
MNPIRDPHELAGEYVLGTLDAAQRREVALALRDDAALRAAVAAWEERLLPLVSLAEPVVPSAALWVRIERSTLPPARPEAPVARWWNALGLWRGLAAGGFAAAAIMAVVVGVRVQAPASPAYMVVLAQPQSMAPGWIVRVNDSRMLRLEPLVRTEVPAQKALQLWTKADGWKGPVSLGLVTPGQPFEVRLDKLPPLQPNQLFEITLEPANGSPIGRPTGPILFIGRAVKTM